MCCNSSLPAIRDTFLPPPSTYTVYTSFAISPCFFHLSSDQNIILRHHSNQLLHAVCTQISIHLQRWKREQTHLPTTDPPIGSPLTPANSTIQPATTLTTYSPLVHANSHTQLATDPLTYSPLVHASSPTPGHTHSPATTLLVVAVNEGTRSPWGVTSILA